MSLITEYLVPAMGSEFILRCYPQQNFSQEDCLALFKQGESEIQRIENELTEYRESPFNDINKNAGQRPVVVSKEIFQLIEYCQKIALESNGLFDITTSSFIYHQKKALKEKRPLEAREATLLKELIDYTKVELDIKKRSVFLPHPKMRIGLGGVGKGYAVDRVYDLLKNAGMINFYINGSGDIRVHSHHGAPRRWKIGLQNPFNPQNIVGLIQLSHGAIASSGTYKQKGHIYSAKEQEIVSASVLRETCLEADTLGTILIAMNKTQAVNYLDKRGIAGILITHDGRSTLSQKALSLFGK